MLAKLFLIDNVGVTCLAGVVSRKCNRPRRDLTDRRTAIMAIPPKTFRHDCGPQNYERRQPYREYKHQPDEMFDVFKQVCVPSCQPRLASEKGQCT
jgi:hypothetical protein